jgi:hypothetical protein
MQKDSLPKCVIFSIEAEQILPFSFLSFFFVVLGMEARALHIEVSLFNCSNDTSILGRTKRR